MGAWAVRFRVAALTLCAAVGVLLISGLVAGLSYDTPTGSAVDVPREFLAYNRAQQLLSGANVFTALLLVVAVLLVVAAGDEVEPAGRAVLRVSALLALIVALGALTMAGVTVWYAAAIEGHGIVGAISQPLGQTLAATVVAGAALWWARTATAATVPAEASP